MIITAVCFCLICYSAFEFVSTFFENKVSKIIVEESLKLHSRQHSLVNDKLPPIIGLSLGHGVDYLDNYQELLKYITPMLVMTDYTTDDNGLVMTHSTPVSFELCSKVKIFESAFESFKNNTDPHLFNILKYKGFCPNLTEEQAESFFTSREVQPFKLKQIVLSIYPCSLEDTSQCRDLSQIHGAYSYYVSPTLYKDL